MLFQFYGEMKEYLPPEVNDKVMKTLRTQERESEEDVLGFTIIASEKDAHKSVNYKQFPTARRKIPPRSMNEQMRIEKTTKVLERIKRG